MWPARIDYEDGDIVLPGYELKKRPDRALLAGGLITLLIPYSISFLVGGVAAIDGGGSDLDEYGTLLIPVFGPFIALGSWDYVTEEGRFVSLANGFTQLAGAAMITSSLLMPEKYLERMAALPGKPEVFVGAGNATLRFRF